MPAKARLFWGATSRARITALDWVNAFALGSLFYDLKTSLSGGGLTPFPFFALIAGLLTLNAFGFRALTIRRRFLPHVIFMFFISAALAFRLGMTNGIRETAQACVVVGWVICFVTTYKRTSPARMIRVFVVLVITSMIFTIAWHALHGDFVGWKLLDNAKITFDLLPAFLCGWILYRRPHKSAAIIGSIAAAILIVLSGERKGIFIAIATLMITYGFLNMRFLRTLGIAAVLAVGVVALFSHTYVGRQLNTLMDPDAYQAQNYLGHHGGGASPVTLSNLARILVFKIGIDRFVESPWLGMGTGAYLPSVFKEYPDLPKEFQQGIHNEFFRVAVENGLIGLAFYLWAWLAAGKAMFTPFRRAYLVNGFPKAMRLQAVLFTSCLIHVTFQANNTMTVLAFLLAPHFDLMVPRPHEAAFPQGSSSKAKPRTKPFGAEPALPRG
jgi:hypothetical protein